MIGYALSNVEDVPGPGARFDRILDLPDCEVHLGPFEDLEHELIYPCAKWFNPPAGQYRIWIEAPDLISEGFGRLTWEDEPFAGQGLSMGMGLLPAGRVALGKSASIPQNASFRLVHLRASHKGKLRRLFDRRSTVELARKGVPILVGPVLTGIFDRKTGDAIALARPVEVSPGKTIFVEPALPMKGSDVLAILTRPSDANPDQADVALHLDIAGKRKVPDAIVAGTDRVIAVWYGLEGRTATLSADSKTLRLSPVALSLRPGSVTTHRGQLARLPSVGISIHGPEDVLRDTEMWAELRLSHASTPLQRIEVVPNRDDRFDSVPAEQVDVVLVVGAWEFRRSLDLTSGRDDAIVFELAPLLISGTVFHGRDPAPAAEVAFQADRDWVRTTTDDAGRYETIVWHRDSYLAEVKVTPGADLPFVDGPLDIGQSRTIDFHVPRTRFEVTVLDALSRQPVADARVTAASVFAKETGEHNVVQTATTDHRGRAALPPMRAGTMVLRARADGYFDSEPTRDVVERIDQEGSYEIALRPVVKSIRVVVEESDGRPAAGAQVWAVSSPSGHQPPLWRGNADDDGILEVPLDLRNAAFLLRAQRSACAVRRLRDGEVSPVWVLRPAAAPLNIRISRKSRVAVWIDGERVSGVPLAFLSGSVEGTDQDGMWSTALLPPEPVRILAWRTIPDAAIESGAYDVVATTLHYPWPSLLELKPVD